MAKKKKTRDQKKIADLRHNFKHQIVPNTFEVKLPSTKIETKKSDYGYNSYPYLVKDLTKTFTLTLTIIGIQILLFLFLKNHVITIPGLLY